MLEHLYNLATDKYNGFFPSVLKAAFYLFSLIYALVVRLIAFCRMIWPVRLPCKVISVGNITLGGTGKTVLVEYIIRLLSARGNKIAVLSRGYKRKNANCGSRVTDYEMMGDEPYMIKKKFPGVPVIVDPDRVRGAISAFKAHKVDTVILDDGFQQWRIIKDLDIVAVDARNPFGNGSVIPRGILREPLSALGRADVFVLTKALPESDTAPLKDRLGKLNPGALIVESSHAWSGFYNITNPRERFGAQELQGRTAYLFCGIGDPESFKNLICGLGVQVGGASVFPDHYNYSQADLDKIIRDAKEKKDSVIITTEKDAARLEGLNAFGERILVASIELKIGQDEKRFIDRLLGLYHS